MRKYLYLASIGGMSGVALGAFGAHALKDTLALRNTAGTWDTAVLYHFIHSLALLCIGLESLRSDGPVSRWISRAGICWTLGILFFSGSLYWLALGGPRWLGPVTPLGGVAFILGWAFLLIGALQTRRPIR